MRKFALSIVALLIGVASAPCGIATDPPVAPEQIADWVAAAEQRAVADCARDALSIYELLLKYVPENSSLLGRIGQLHYQRGDFAAAGESFSRAAQFAPNRATYQNDAGYAYWKAKKYRLALEHLQRAVELDPRSLRYANNLATLYIDMGDDKKAITALSDAHQNHASVHFNMAYLYEERQRDNEAMTHVEAALSHDPNLTRAVRLRDKLARP